REVVDERVVREPGQDLGERGHGAAGRLSDVGAQLERAGRARPEARGLRRVLRGAGARVARRERGGADEPARDPQRKGARGAAVEDEEGLAARTAVREEELVAADALEGRAGRRLEAEGALREAPTKIGVGEEAH